MRRISTDQDYAARIAIPWARDRIGLAHPFDEKAKAIMLIDDLQLLAVTVYTDYTGNNVAMHIASDGSRRWMTHAFLRASFAYPFEQLGVLRVTGLVYASNLDSLNFCRHLGFVEEGRMRRASQDGSDLLVLGMLRQECRHLKDEHGSVQRRSGRAAVA